MIEASSGSAAGVLPDGMPCLSHRAASGAVKKELAII
jgi:hypothetical protein